MGDAKTAIGVRRGCVGAVPRLRRGCDVAMPGLRKGYNGAATEQCWGCAGDVTGL